MTESEQVLFVYSYLFMKTLIGTENL